MKQGRRRILKSGLAAGSLFLPLPYAWVRAQTDEARHGALQLLKAPKVALVVGNGRYKDAAELKNPSNDARAIGETLKASGFAATILLDAGRDALLSAIRDYVRALERQRAVGLFYFAGHGVQLDWRNYMLPVDAAIDRVEDVARQSVDVGQLMEGLTKAANPMNVIILDACRDDPFGTARKPAQKGLSQMDAPKQTMLAYATSPGNVASDGEGVNGLYTENLLREIRVPEAKIEDVFKRVRLAVRRRSNGAQIPWESTSLEEDFWFLPPKELRELSEAEKEREFAAELELWEKVAEAPQPAPLEDYLRRYPSGRFSELAQLALDRVLARQGEKRIAIASAEGNPYTKGSARADLGYKVGDSYSYRVLDLETRAEKRAYTSTVTEVRESEVVFDKGLVLDLLGNLIQLPDGRRFTPRQDQPLEYAVGKKWTTRTSVRNERTGRGASLDFEFQVSGRERIEVPAGRFDCFVIDAIGTGLAVTGARVETRLKRWMAPDRLRQPVALETVRKVWIQRQPKPPAEGGFFKGGYGKKGKGPGDLPPIERVEESVRQELTAFKQG